MRGRLLLFGLYKAFGVSNTLAEEVFADLVSEPLAGACVCHGKTVFVNKHRLEMLPLFPGFLGDIQIDLFAEFAGKRRVIEAFGFAAELDAVNHACHVVLHNIECSMFDDFNKTEGTLGIL